MEGCQLTRFIDPTQMPVLSSTRPGRHRRPNIRLSVVAAGVVLVLLASGCAEAEPDPEEERQSVIRTRLEETFSNAQVDCIMDRLDDSVLQALDRDTDLDPEGDAMVAYTEAVTSCVADPDSPPPDTAPGEDEPSGEDAPADDAPADDDPDAEAPEEETPDEAPADEAGEDGSDG